MHETSDSSGETVDQIMDRLRQLGAEASACHGHEVHRREEPCKNQCPGCEKRLKAKEIKEAPDA
jgi:hypothetical protein